MAAEKRTTGAALTRAATKDFARSSEVLRHFQRASKIKAAAKVAHVSKVDRPETIGRNFQQMPRNIIAVHAKIVGYAVPFEFLEPAANTAAEIHDRMAWEQ
jgi:cyanophycinase-like exopeptidase